jgi:hypothetical protein
MSGSGSGGAVPVRFHVQLRDAGGPSGDESTATNVLTLASHPSASFGDIKARLWAKLGSVLPAAAHCPPPADYLFQLATGEMTFEDDDVLSRFIASVKHAGTRSSVRSTPACERLTNCPRHVVCAACLLIRQCE